MPRVWLFVAVVVAAPVGAAEPIDEAYFERKVRPLIAAHCSKCHDAGKQKGGLQLTSRASALKGGDTGPAIVPGDAAKSLLAQAVGYAGDIKMPPKGKLTDDEIVTLTAWIAGGAPWPDSAVAVNAPGPKGLDVKGLAERHWSFRPVVRPPVPAVRDAAWVLTPIDRFLLAKLEAARLKPANPADPRALARRLSFDLTGLPPSPELVEAFARDPSPIAYKQLVENLLASPQYGERWGRHWLDLVRYAETMGHEFDGDIPDAWRYRDYVIRAFNHDLPYDQFVTEHIAGDLLPKPRQHPTDRFNESILGTGFWVLGEAKHSPVDVRQDQADRLDNMIDVFGKSFLGLTIACARCHDHKFDPIPTKDFYALYGILASSRQQHAFIDDLSETESRLTALREALAAKNQPRPAIQDGDRSPDAIAALEKWRNGSTAFEAFGPEWSERWSLTGPAFHTAGEYPYSARDAIALAGVIRSRTFRIERDRIAVRVAGQKGRLRLIVDNYQLIQNPIYGGLTKTFDHGEEFRWIVFEVARWKGHAAYLEAIDDGPGYLAMGEVSFSDHPPPAGKLGRVPPPPQSRINDTDQLAQKIRELETKLANPRRAPALADGTGLNEHVFTRGNPKILGEAVPRRFLEVFAGPSAKGPSAGSGRLELAKAVADPANPLVARVIVNRIWHHHFGVGLVPSTDDFGRMGQPPSHPELLDWLAAEFVASDWSIKNLHRQIVHSSTYRMASQPHPDASERAATIDPQNKLLHRFNLRRLEAEAIRDAILSVSGKLDRTMGGPGVPPYLTEHMAGRGRPAASGPLDGNGRRSVYLQVRRNFPNPLFTAFDYPTPFTTIGRRTTSNVPAQALVMLNNPFVIQQADAWAKRICGEETLSSDRVRRMYRMAFARTPDDREVVAATGFIADQQAAGLTNEQAWAALAHALLNTKEFVFVE